MRHEEINAKICAVDDAGTRGVMAVAANYSCARCGAKAHEARNVCDPVQLPEAGMFGD